MAIIKRATFVVGSRGKAVLRGLTMWSVPGLITWRAMGGLRHFGAPRRNDGISS
jgi:hypothetical protein